MIVDCAEIRGYCVVATKYNGAEEQAEAAQQSRAESTVLLRGEGKGVHCVQRTTHAEQTISTCRSNQRR